MLIVGDVMHDQYWQGDCQRLSPEAPVPVINVTRTIDRLGGAANVAVNVRAMGAHVVLIGMVGQDDSANKVRHLLVDHGVAHHLLIDRHKPTTKKLRIIQGHNHQLIRADFESPFIKHAGMHELFCEQVQRCDVVIFSDYNKGTLCAIETLIAAAKKQRKRIIVDPKRVDFSCYAGADVVTPNKQEILAAIGEQDTVGADIDVVIPKVQQLLDRHKIAHILITLGEKGMLLVSPHSIHTVPSEALEITDVTGAGDTVVATLGCAWSADRTLVEAMKIANLAAGIVVAKSGSAVATVEEIAHGLHDWETEKILDQARLTATSAHLRSRGRKIVLTNGCFDMLHVGHAQYLREAKLLGDILIVAVNSDESVRTLKGKNRPINSLADRMTMLATLEMVDYVVMFTEHTPNAIISALQPDVLVKGGDYQDINEVVGAEQVFAYGGDVKLLGRMPNHSTSATINRIQSLSDQQDA